MTHGCLQSPITLSLSGDVVQHGIAFRVVTSGKVIAVGAILRCQKGLFIDATLPLLIVKLACELLTTRTKPAP
jgi:hypothetical protein